MAEMLRVENLHVRFGVGEDQVKALNGIDLTLEEGEIYCMVGESGAGKSTLALAIMGLLPIAGTIPQGKVIFDGVDLVQAAVLSPRQGIPPRASPAGAGGLPVPPRLRLRSGRGPIDAG